MDLPMLQRNLLAPSSEQKSTSVTEKSIRGVEEDKTGNLNEPTGIRRGKNICPLKGLVSRAEGLGKIVANILSYALIN
jgi:hypothetical protein